MEDCGCKVEVDSEEKKAKIYIPVDRKVAQDIEAGDTVEIVIKGKVVGGSFRLKKEEWDDSTGNLDVEIDKIEINGRNEFQDIVD